MKKKFYSLHLKLLRNEEHFGFMEQCIEKIALLPAEKVVLQKAAFREAMEQEQEALRQKKWKERSQQLAELNVLRGKAWNGLRMLVNVMLMHPDLKILKAARHVNRLLKKFGDPRKQPYLQQNGTLRKLLDVLGKPAVVAELNLLNATSWVSELKQYNDEFMRVFALRAGLIASHEKGVVKKARLATDAAWHELLFVVDALAVMEGEEAYVPFTQAMNELIDYQRKVLARRRREGVRKKLEEKRQEEPGTEDAAEQIVYKDEDVLSNKEREEDEK